MPQKNFFTLLIALSAIIVVTFSGSTFGYIERVYAAALTSLSDTHSSVKVSTLSDHTIQFITPTGVAAAGNITITFPAGYTMGTFNVNNIDFATSTTGACTGLVDGAVAAAAAGGTWGVAQAGQVITITSGTGVIPANRCIQIEIGSNATFGATGVSQITNPASANTYAITIAGGFGDNGTITSNIITDDTVSVSATVQQSITFTISTTTIYFGNLSSGAPKYASSTSTTGDTLENIAHTLAVATNAPSGYNLSIRGQTLTSQQNASNTILAIGSTASSSSAGNEQFGIRATVSGGTGATVDATFASTTAFGFDATATTSAAFALGIGSTNTSTYSLRYMANIGGTTEAGTYVANLVYVATANF